MTITTQSQEETPPRSFRRSYAPEEPETDGMAISLDHERLRREHQALDEQIEALHGSPANDLAISTLKRQKLQLKDQIRRLESLAS